MWPVTVQVGFGGYGEGERRTRAGPASGLKPQKSRLSPAAVGIHTALFVTSPPCNSYGASFTVAACHKNGARWDNWRGVYTFNDTDQV